MPEAVSGYHQWLLEDPGRQAEEGLGKMLLKEMPNILSLYFCMKWHSGLQPEMENRVGWSLFWVVKFSVRILVLTTSLLSFS